MLKKHETETQMKYECTTALFNNMQTLRYKAKLTIMFYAAVNHYRNRHLKAETTEQNGSKSANHEPGA